MSELKKYIRSVPDFPKPGILFFDVTTLFADPAGLELALSLLYDAAKDKGITKVV
jgi:adenine phosphoribosyltransferase